MKIRLIGYWTATATLAFVVLSGGVADLMQWSGTLETVTILGYPAYLLSILGLWKVLGGVTLLMPGFPRLKEWAYAGIFFEMTGAAASHAVTSNWGAFGWHFLVTAGLAAVVIVSWALRPPARVVGSLTVPAALSMGGDVASAAGRGGSD